MGRLPSGPTSRVIAAGRPRCALAKTIQRAEPVEPRRSSSKAPAHPAKKAGEAAADARTTTPNTQTPQIGDGGKTQTQLDQELQERLEAMSGGGGSAVSYENGSAQGLRREVKRNMFRVIG